MLKPRTEHKLADGRYAQAKLKQFGTRIRRWRKKELLTRSERAQVLDPVRRGCMPKRGLYRRMLAARVGCHEQQIFNIEKGHNAPSWALYCALCREMGVEPLANFPTV